MLKCQSKSSRCCRAKPRRLEVPTSPAQAFVDFKFMYMYVVKHVFVYTVCECLLYVSFIIIIIFFKCANK